MYHLVRLTLLQEIAKMREKPEISDSSRFKETVRRLNYIFLDNTKNDIQKLKDTYRLLLPLRFSPLREVFYTVMQKIYGGRLPQLNTTRSILRWENQFLRIRRQYRYKPTFKEIAITVDDQGVIVLPPEHEARFIHDIQRTLGKLIDDYNPDASDQLTLFVTGLRKKGISEELANILVILLGQFSGDAICNVFSAQITQFIYEEITQMAKRAAKSGISPLRVNSQYVYSDKEDRVHDFFSASTLQLQVFSPNKVRIYILEDFTVAGEPNDAEIACCHGGAAPMGSVLYEFDVTADRYQVMITGKAMLYAWNHHLQRIYGLHLADYLRSNTLGRAFLHFWGHRLQRSHSKEDVLDNKIGLTVSHDRSKSNLNTVPVGSDWDLVQYRFFRTASIAEIRYKGSADKEEDKDDIMLLQLPKRGSAGPA